MRVAEGLVVLFATDIGSLKHRYDVFEDYLVARNCALQLLRV